MASKKSQRSTPKTRKNIKVKSNGKIDLTSLSSMSDCKLELNLESYGYYPIRRISINNKNDNSVHYIKAINKNGEKVYIMIDVDEVFPSFPSDCTMKMETDGNTIPLSVKSGAIKSASLEVSGVAFECDDDGVTVIYRRKNDVHPIEVNYSFNISNCSNCVIIFPVVRLSEIYIDNDIVVENTSIVTCRLRNNIHNILIKDINSFGSSLTSLNESFCNFHEIYEEYSDLINKDFDYYIKLNKYYNSLGPLDECDKLEHKNAYESLVNRNNGVVFLLTSLKNVSDKKDIINDCVHLIDEIVNDLNNL
jgi:hypothetical protein